MFFQQVCHAFAHRLTTIDKQTDCWTVSQKFRDDVKQYFAPKTYNLLEVGCYKGYTARSLSRHFIQYLGVDNNVEFLQAARLNNLFSANVKFKRFNLYESDWREIEFPADIVLIDARHKYQYIKQDIENSLKRFGRIYLIFDDYGAWESVFTAVNEAVDAGKIEVLQNIGMGQGQRLWADPANPKSFTHFGSEGLICRSL